jgi:hypothetical protein
MEILMLYDNLLSSVSVFCYELYPIFRIFIRIKSFALSHKMWNFCEKLTGTGLADVIVPCEDLRMAHAGVIVPCEGLRMCPVDMIVSFEDLRMAHAGVIVPCEGLRMCPVDLIAPCEDLRTLPALFAASIGRLLRIMYLKIKNI